MNGKIIGVLEDSTSQQTIDIFNDLLRKKLDVSSTNLIKVETFPKVSIALIDLVEANPKVDFVLADKAYTQFCIRKNKLKNLKLLELTLNFYPPEFHSELIEENYGITVNYQASDLLEKINETIDNLNQNDQLNKMIELHKSHYDNKNSSRI